MDETTMLIALAMFTLLAAVCSIIFNKLKLPPLIGYIVAGILLVNVLFLYQDEGTVADEEEIIELLKNMGLVMLMFCIGLEINLKKIRKQGSFAILVAVIQLPLMVLGGFIAGTLLGYDMTQSIVLGAIISGSSTAVIMAVLHSQGHLDREHIDMLVLITIMEDIGQVIILSIITPLMANYSMGGMGGMDVNDIIVLIVKILAFMIISILVGMKVVPRLINWISDNVSDEILTITSVGLAFGMALLANYVGLSMSIGAFLMGMMVASSRKAKDINTKIEPMRDLFMAIFFISIGAEVYPASMLLDNISTIVMFYLLFVVLKTATVFLAYWAGNESCRNGFISATSLCAMGEFAFIIAAEALSEGVVDNDFYTSVIGAALLSMITLPFLSKFSDRIWDKSVEKCPRKLYRACCSLNDARSRVYERIAATSKKSQKAVYKSMTHTYINIFVLAIIEIAFYFIMPPLVDWLVDAFGATEMVWVLILLCVNFLVLSAPTYYLINNVKFLDEMIISGAKRIASREGSKDNPSERYEKFLNFLDLNTYLLIVVIDFLIILLMPNAVEVELWYYLVILCVAVLAILAMYVKRLRARKREQEADAAEESPADETSGLDGHHRRDVPGEPEGRLPPRAHPVAPPVLGADHVDPVRTDILEYPLDGRVPRDRHHGAHPLQEVGVGAAGEPYAVRERRIDGGLVVLAGHPARDHLICIEAAGDRGVEDPLADADLHALVRSEVPHGMGGGHDAVLALAQLQEPLRRAVPERQPGVLLDPRTDAGEPEPLQVPVVREVDQDVGAVGGADLHPRDHRDPRVGVPYATDGGDQVVVGDREPDPPALRQADGRHRIGGGVRAVGVEVHVDRGQPPLGQGSRVRGEELRPHLLQRYPQASSHPDRTSSVSRVRNLPSSTTTSPWHMTVLTLRLLPEYTMLAMTFSGTRGLRLGALPSSITMSAYLPGSIEPMRSCMPTALAPFTVAKSRSSWAVATLGSQLPCFWSSPSSLISANMSRVLFVVLPSVPTETLTPAAWNWGTGARPAVASFMLDAGQLEMDMPASPMSLTSLIVR